MLSRNLIPAVCFLLIGTFSFCSTASAEILIDDYTAGSTIARFTAGTSSQLTIAPGSILGGVRNDSLTVRDLAGNEFFGILGFNGDAQIGQGSQDQILGSMLYNNFTAVDLTDGGHQFKFQVEVVGVDSATPITDAFSITVASGASTSTVNFDLPGTGSVPTYVDINFSEFAGIDFTSIDSIEMSFDFLGKPGHDLALASFRAVPEPTQAILLLAGLGGLATRRRR